MIIHEPEINIVDGQIKIAVHLDSLKSNKDWPDTLWFCFPENQSEFVSESSDSFITTLLPLAMHDEEDLEVRGFISPKLASNLNNYQHFHAEMRPRDFSFVDITYHQLKMAEFCDKRYHVTSFSGGIDSFYTLWSNLVEPTNLNPTQISHALFIKGFDILKSDYPLFNSLRTEYKRLLASIGVELLLAESNFMDFYRYKINWVDGHYGPLIGTIHALGKGIKSYHKPSDFEAPHGKVGKPGFYIPLLSTEITEIILDAPNLLRFEKLQQMKNWRPIHHTLRVCTNPKKQVEGKACYRCLKCLNTTLVLDMEKIRSKFNNFPRSLSMLEFIRFALLQERMGNYLEKDWAYKFIKSKKREWVIIFYLCFPIFVIKYSMSKLFHFLPRRTRYTIKKLLFNHS